MNEREVADTVLAHWLADRMRDAELSQNQVAEGTRLAQSKVWGILKRGDIPKPATLDKLAEYFRVSPMLLYRLTYFPESEEGGFPPEVLAQFRELESILEKVDHEQQLEFIRSLVVQARMLEVAAARWRVGEKTME